MKRERAVHWPTVPLGNITYPRCSDRRTFTWNMRFAQRPEDVTCRVCLYHLGLYMPLVKLREHQSEQSHGRAGHGARDPFYQKHTCMGCGRELVPTPHGLRCPTYPGFCVA